MEALRPRGWPQDPGSWPQERTSKVYLDRWLHSDIKNIAMPYIYTIYEVMLIEGKFIDEN